MTDEIDLDAVLTDDRFDIRLNVFISRLETAYMRINFL